MKRLQVSLNFSINPKLFILIKAKFGIYMYIVMLHICVKFHFDDTKKPMVSVLQRQGAEHTLNKITIDQNTSCFQETG